MWPLFATTAAYAMNTFASEALSSFSPFQLIFLRDPPDLTCLSFPKIDTIPVNYHEYYNLLFEFLGNSLTQTNQTNKQTKQKFIRLNYSYCWIQRIQLMNKTKVQPNVL